MRYHVLLPVHIAHLLISYVCVSKFLITCINFSLALLFLALYFSFSHPLFFSLCFLLALPTYIAHSNTFRPILEGESLERVERSVEQFLGEHGVGEQARAHLQDRGEQTDNWAYQYWFKVGGWMDGWMN